MIRGKDADERTLLAFLARHRDSLFGHMKGLRKSDFRDARHARIFGAISDNQLDRADADYLDFGNPAGIASGEPDEQDIQRRIGLIRAATKQRRRAKAPSAAPTANGHDQPAEDEAAVNYPPPATSMTFAAPEPRQVHGPLAKKRTNMRTSELKTLHWNGPARKQFRQLDAFLANLRQRLGGRDPRDPEQVSAQKLGHVLELTLARKIDIEDRATEGRRRKGWKLFRFRTIAPCDKSPEQVQKFYKQRANKAGAAKKKADCAAGREMEQLMQTQQQTMPHTRAGLMAAQKANTRARRDAILDVLALDDGWWPVIPELEAELRDSPAWLGPAIGVKVFRRAMHDRLDELKAENLIEDKHEPSPHGHFPRRLVRRI